MTGAPTLLHRRWPDGFSRGAAFQFSPHRRLAPSAATVVPRDSAMLRADAGLVERETGYRPRLDYGERRWGGGDGDLCILREAIDWIWQREG